MLKYLDKVGPNFPAREVVVDVWVTLFLQLSPDLEMARAFLG